ncbi:MAG: conjugal transfer protein TrbE, partial [Methylocystaceae bacterium]|nr:conjugal transfer protein TrbE [Methylocystaceae bacterium]
MLNLKEYRFKANRLADFIPWAALVAEGIVLNKDGSFQRTASFRGPDLDSSVPAELIAVSARLNNALRRLGSGWAVFFEAQRNPAQTYPISHFPDSASRIVDHERRAQFEEQGVHFESSYYLTLLFLPPEERSKRKENFLFEGIDPDTNASGQEILAYFSDHCDRLLQLLDGFMPDCAWLSSEETLTYLHSSISTKRHRLRVPEIPMYLDALLIDQPLTGGLAPMLGDQHLRILTITGFPSITT